MSEKLLPPLIIVRDMNTEPDPIEEVEQCDRSHCGEDAVGEDTRGVPVCQYHAEESWAND